VCVRVWVGDRDEIISLVRNTKSLNKSRNFVTGTRKRKHTRSAILYCMQAVLFYLYFISLVLCTITLVTTKQVT